MRKKLLSLGLAILMMFALVGCDEDWEDEDDVQVAQTSVVETGTSSNQTEIKGAESVKSIQMSLNDDKLEIERVSIDNKVPMGEEGTWTVFVYMCGSDLESEDGLATGDLIEMEEAATSENIQFVIQTGGASYWDADISNTAFERYLITGEGTYRLETKPGKSMGESDVLADFLTWGVTNYPAYHMGLVFWNHGGGSISGVCFDENYDNDSLSLREIDAALLSTHEHMTDTFEFIGFDACLMATVETANILASYADYMIASEETEPGYGWNYTEIGKYLDKNPKADGAQLGRVVVDSFYEACEEIDSEDDATLAVIDLSKMNDLLICFNDFSKEIYDAAEDNSKYAATVRNLLNADNFGGNNKAEGYTNMVDLAGVVNAGSEYSTKTAEVLRAIDAAIVYKKNGATHKNACGLSTYYPLSIQGSEELSIFSKIAISPYYLAFVDRSAYGSVNSGDFSEYDSSQLVNQWGDYGYTQDQTGSLEEEEVEDDYWEYYDDADLEGESSLITFEEAPQIYEDGIFGFVLDEDGLYYTASVSAVVYLAVENNQEMIEYGVSTDLYMDWSSGEFYDRFDGTWFALPDGQNLAVYNVAECDGYDLYVSPVSINGEEMYLRFRHDYSDDSVYLEGATDGVDESGMASRVRYQLKEGDVIVPLYQAFDVDTLEEFMYYGSEYVYDGNPELYFDYLYDGDYYYCFCIMDVYGDYYYSDYELFTVEDGKVWY